MTDDPQSQATRAFIAALPHCRALDMALDAVEPGIVTLSMPWAEKLVGDPRSGVIHGGAVSALMDTAGGAAVLCHPEAGVSTATMDLRIDYMRAANPHQRIVARAECHTVTRSVAFVRAEARDDDGVVAQATGAFTLDRR